MSDVDQIKQKALFTTGGLLLGWSLFKIFHRLTSSTVPHSFEKVPSGSDLSSSQNGEGPMKRMISQMSSIEMTKSHSQNLTEITSKQFDAQQSEYKSTEDFLERAKVRLAKVSHLKEMFPDLKPLQSPIFERASRSVDQKGTIATTLFSQPGTFCLQETFYSQPSELQTSLKFLRSTASTQIYSDPAKTKVVIATCGGIVPGMNVVIRSLVKCLEQEYGVRDIYGARYGFWGLSRGYS